MAELTYPWYGPVSREHSAPVQRPSLRAVLPRPRGVHAGHVRPSHTDGVSAPLPERAADTTAEAPWPVRLLSMKIGDYVSKMSPLWVEGQIVQLTRRPGSTTAYLTLRDTDVDMSLAVSCPVPLLDALGVPLSDGARVVVHAKAAFWARRGTLTMEARAIRPVGQGELLARLEHLKRVLAAEGLFAPERKTRLPFLPRRVGLICGRASAAERDVVENARRRCPAVSLLVRQVPVQGPDAVQAVIGALRELDRIADVDVIVVARGGGSFEDLLPFSNEALVRAVAAATTPVVSAIGHDIDAPLLDYVADLRASTPTDAAKRIVPDVAAERAWVAEARRRASAALRATLAHETRLMAALASRPVLADPAALFVPHRRLIDTSRQVARRRVESDLTRAVDHLGHLCAQLRALSPGATLDRGYAIVEHGNGRIVRDRHDVSADELLRIRVARGDFAARAVGG